MYYKFIRLPLTEQKSLRGLNEETLRSIYHYQSSIQRNSARDQKTVEEHAVPVKIIADILADYCLADEDNEIQDRIREVLDRLLWVVFITYEENKKLNRIGLKSSMPEGWSWKTDSPFIRYELAGIEVDWNI